MGMLLVYFAFADIFSLVLASFSQRCSSIRFYSTDEKVRLTSS